MINRYDQVSAAQYKESGFTEGIRNNEGLPFPWGIDDSAALVKWLPTCAAVKGFSRGAVAVFLEEPESDACVGLICDQASWFGFLKDVYSLFNFIAYH